LSGCRPRSGVSVFDVTLFVSYIVFGFALNEQA
jgi:hypothetical protein